MKIESINIKNYKVFKACTIKSLSKMSVFLGLNGSGKSTFTDIFVFLHDALQTNVTVAINRRGGFAEVISRGSDITKDFISFEINLHTTLNNEIKDILINYFLEIGNDNGKIFVNKEILKYKQEGSNAENVFIDFFKGEGYVIVNEYENNEVKIKKENQKVSSSDILAIKGFGQFERYRIISDFRFLLEQWYVCDLDTNVLRNNLEIGISEHLSVSGHNLAQVTKYIYDYHRDTFNQILEKLPKRIPGIAKVEAKETEEGMIVLKFQDKSFSS